MNIRIENYKNLKELDYTIDDNKINFLFGMSGSGKSSILNAISSDKPNENKRFGAKQTEQMVIKVDGSDISPTDTHVFNIEKMDFMLEQSDVEYFREVILVNNSEHIKIHKELEIKIASLSNAINNEMHIYEQYGSFLDSIKAKKLNKNNTLPASSPFSKVMIKIRSFNKTKIFEEIASMDNKLFEWKMKGIPFMNNNACPFCEKVLSKKKVDKLTKMSSFDAKSIGGVKDSIGANISLLSFSLSYDYKEMKRIEKEIINFSLAVKSFEEIVNQFHNAFEENYDYKSISKIKVTSQFKKMFPLTSKEYDNVFRNVRSLKTSIRKTQEKTNTFLKGKKKIVNDIFELMNIPYEFNVKYHRGGPNEYSIIHKKDANRNDDKGCMSDGERAIVSLVLFLASAKATTYKLYLIDDPVSSFDVYRRKIVYDLILKYLKGKTTVVLSHDPVFAKFAIQNNRSNSIGTISYLSNNGSDSAIIQSVKNVKIESFAKSVVERCSLAANQYEQFILARLLLEEHFGKNNPLYSYLSMVLHGYSYSDIQNWIISGGKTEIDIVNSINNTLHSLGLPCNYLSLLSPTYNSNIDISNYTVYEKCIVLREMVDKNKKSYSSGIRSELNNSVHLNEVLAIGMNVFEFPLISRTLFDEISSLPNIISL